MNSVECNIANIVSEYEKVLFNYFQRMNYSDMAIRDMLNDTMKSVRSFIHMNGQLSHNPIVIELLPSTLELFPHLSANRLVVLLKRLSKLAARILTLIGTDIPLIINAIKNLNTHLKLNGMLLLEKDLFSKNGILKLLIPDDTTERKKPTFRDGYVIELNAFLYSIVFLYADLNSSICSELREFR